MFGNSGRRKYYGDKYNRFKFIYVYVIVAFYLASNYIKLGFGNDNIYYLIFLPLLMFMPIIPQKIIVDNDDMDVYLGMFYNEREVNWHNVSQIRLHINNRDLRGRVKEHIKELALEITEEKKIHCIKIDDIVKKDEFLFQIRRICKNHQIDYIDDIKKSIRQ